MYYAFQFKDGIETTTFRNDKIVIAGQLMKFYTKELRDAWVSDGFNYRSEKFRRKVKIKNLPHGWSTEDADLFLESERICFKILENINHEWLDSSITRQYPLEHWAYVTDARLADDFSKRLKECKSESELKHLRKEEKQSVIDVCRRVKNLLIKAMVSNNPQELINDARDIWSKYGCPAEVDDFEDILIHSKEEEDDFVFKFHPLTVPDLI